MLKKRILFPISNNSAKLYYFVEGLAYVYAKNHEVLVIGIEQKPIFDIFAEWKPDIVFVVEEDYNDTFIRCIAKYPIPVVVLYNTQENKLKDDICRINVDAFGAIANTFKFVRNPEIKKSVDISYISEYDLNKDNSLPFALSNSDLTFHIYSNKPWPLTQWIGSPNGNEAYIYNRSKIVMTDNPLDSENINSCGAYRMETEVFDLEDVKRGLKGYEMSQEPTFYNTYEHVVETINKRLSKKYVIEL